MSFSSRFLTMAAAATGAFASAHQQDDSLQHRQQDIPATHLIVLVHGWMGNAQEMDYMKQSLERQSQKYAPQNKFVIVSPTVNEGRTHDGIAAGGERLAEEVTNLIQEYKSDNSITTLSFVGNSLGGLYGRFALSKLDLSEVEPMVFCTTATPHLGVSRHTYIPLPRFGEWAVAHILRPTGIDLFNVSPVIEEMAFQSTFTSPLLQFRKRIAYANAHGTDFQVPTCTAAFLCPKSPHPHLIVDDDNDGDDDSTSSEHFVLTVETQQDENLTDPTSLPASVGHALDQMGWKKVFCDVRDKIPLPSMPRPFGGSNDHSIPRQESYTAKELIPIVTAGGSRMHFPLGHQVLVANSKQGWYTAMSAGGRPVVDQMASEMISDIIKFTEQLSQEKETCSEYEA